MVDFISIQEQVAKPFHGRPHLVILGAGASRAAFPNGDRRGRMLPVMANLTETLGLLGTLEKYGLSNQAQDFEGLYSDLCSSGNSSELLETLEAEVRNYFSVLEIPDEVTIYDRLVLGLREKDVIATFNWDPLLFQTLQRHYGSAPLPRALYLHGNVAIGYCENDKVKGPIEGECMKCGQPFKPSRLLFPVKDKDYASDPLLEGEWKAFEDMLEGSYLLTLFGYGAPVTDAKAVEIMKQAWRRPGTRELEQFEIIDIRDEAELRTLWEPFIVRSHYGIKKSFEGSMVARWPRRTCEAIWNQFMMLKVSKTYPMPKTTIPDVHDWVRPFLAPELMGYQRAPNPGPPAGGNRIPRRSAAED